MVGPGEKGLASSRWAPINTGRPPYYWTSNKFRHPAPSSTSTSTATHTTSTTTTTTTSTISANPPPPPPTSALSTTPANTTTTTSYSAVDPSALTRVPTPWSELARFTRIARRMRWKLPFLGQAYRAATDTALNTPDDRAEAELMFKLDFFEYYMLLERALVHLMGVFGVRVTGGFGGAGAGAGAGSRSRPNANGNGAVGGSGNGATQSDHRFHANVLDALDDPRNPLHSVLGAAAAGGDARYALARAKELRNRWKNADEQQQTGSEMAARARPLEDYDLERILGSVFEGLEGAYAIAESYVAGVRALAAERGVGGVSGAGAGAGVGEEEAQWEFMVDAMDWEAV